MATVYLPVGHVHLVMTFIISQISRCFGQDNSLDTHIMLGYFYNLIIHINFYK